MCSGLHFNTPSTLLLYSDQQELLVTFNTNTTGSNVNSND